MNAYNTLFIDLDNTLLDFTAAERCAIKELFSSFGMNVTEELIKSYSDFNDSLWKKLERGELTRDRLISCRFCDFFKANSLPFDGKAAAERYFVLLSGCGQLINGAVPFLEKCRGKIPVYAVSNGVGHVQYPRIEKARIGGYFEKVFLSEDLGFEKPDVRFFEKAASAIPGFDKSKALIAGDSLSADIAGGIGFGIDTCLYDPFKKAKKSAFTPTYTVSSLSHLSDILFGGSLRKN